MSNIWRWQLLAAVIGILTSINVVDGTSDPDKDILGPLIIPNQSEIILKQGQNFTLRCKSNFPIKIEQQEIPEEIVVPIIKVSRNSSNTDEEYEYTFELDLYNVNQFTVGYYACFDSNLNGSDIFKNMLEEPTDTEYISYIYIYVDDTGILFAPMREVVIVQNTDSIVIECKPTTPDVNVTLFGQPNNKTIKHLKYSPKIGFLAKKSSSYVFQCYGRRGNETKWKRNITYRPGNALDPNIENQFEDFLEGETFSLNCTITYQPNSPVSLSWKPVLKDRVLEHTNENSTIGKLLYRSITIVNATEDDAREYTCISKSTNRNAEKTAKKVYRGKTGYLKVSTDRRNNTAVSVENKNINLKFYIESYPKADFKIYKNEELLPNDTSKYSIIVQGISVFLKINNLTVYDTANYTLTLSNKYYSKSKTYFLYVKAKPVILRPASPDVDRFYPLGSKTDFQCKAVGFPLPNIYWIFSDENEKRILENINISKDSLIQVSSILSIGAYVSGNITCVANNSFDKTPQEYSRRFLVSEVAHGFGIDKNDENLWFYESQQVVEKCYASIYKYSDIKWFKGEDVLNASFQNTTFSIVSVLNISEISVEDSGEYTCVGYTFENMTTSDSVTFEVSARTQSIVTIPDKDVEEEIKPYQKVTRSCRAEAVPPPVITWFKDGEMLPKENVSYELADTHGTAVIATIDVVLIDEHKSLYECLVESGGVTMKRSYNFVAIDNRKSEIYYIYVIAVILFFLVIVVAYLLWKMRKDRKFKRELLKAGLLYFKKGVPKSINPELGIDEQAELLPYDERFEFPIEKLQIGKQLGAGAFGVVYKAEARGIINAEETTPVAVKMVKKTADNMYIKALASELKIMVHLGKHVNIVNLLGACTKNVGKRELSVIVEYCKFGNIHNYMQKHREVFIDQLTDNKEKNLGKVNRGFESTTGSSGMHSDYFGSNHTQETDHTFVNTANTNRSVRKDVINQPVEFARASETGYIQPEWRTNYESDYIDGRNPRPLTSRDLLAWAFQIARGMEYLANKKVLHGDLAARNVLLAEDNIVKICDFGLARSIYKNDEYQKQENSPLPVKWLAIECMTDRIFSTQSDVWSFGIVLWELFTLAKTPYPNVSPSCLVQWLSDGHRLDKPQYADDRLYDVMLRCWQQKPTARPNFGQLQETLGSFLEDNVRNHYVDLNSAYMDLNMKTQIEEDYLARVCAPDYNNMVTPSPHHYVNEPRSFFPPTPNQLQHDDEGYLQMSPMNQSIFSPRAQCTKFDFDARRLSPIRKSDDCHGPGESTPMLTLNNLPVRSNSESDQEGSVSPYLKMCPRIEEEIDEVFEKQQNFKNMQNNQNTAVTNPTYITFESDLEKKPQNISNNYINVNVPNGLVK